MVRELDNLGAHWDECGAWIYAAAFGRVDVLRWLWIRGVKRKEVYKGKWRGLCRPWPALRDEMVLIAAAMGGHDGVLRFLLDEAATPLGGGRAAGATVLHAAALAGHVNCVRALLLRGCC